eukprot:GEMP01033142.1.p1 GENE.GEMP01033142.1~~GEMP01033142.1.p1  ORF type:complete len:439 (+),score=108.97 GEMP01033142.1:89-1318(+)
MGVMSPRAATKKLGMSTPRGTAKKSEASSPAPTPTNLKTSTPCATPKKPDTSTSSATATMLEMGLPRRTTTKVKACVPNMKNLGTSAPTATTKEAAARSSPNATDAKDTNAEIHDTPTCKRLNPATQSACESGQVAASPPIPNPSAPLMVPTSTKRRRLADDEKLHGGKHFGGAKLLEEKNLGGGGRLTRKVQEAVRLEVKAVNVKTVKKPQPRAAVKKTVSKPQVRAAVKKAVAKPQLRAAVNKVVAKLQLRASVKKVGAKLQPRRAVKKVVRTPGRSRSQKSRTSAVAIIGKRLALQQRRYVPRGSAKPKTTKAPSVAKPLTKQRLTAQNKVKKAITVGLRKTHVRSASVPIIANGSRNVKAKSTIARSGKSGARETAIVTNHKAETRKAVKTNGSVSESVCVRVHG